MSKITIKDMTFVEDLSEEATDIHGGRDNKPGTERPFSFGVELRNTIGLPESESDYYPGLGMQAENVTPL